MRHTIFTLVVITAVSVVSPAGAMAQSQSADSFNCRASAIRLELPSPIGNVEPFRANSPNTPCAASDTAVVDPTVIGPVSADAVRALTARVGTGPGGAAASADNTGITLPGLDIKVQAVQATAASTCSGITPANAGTSRVTGLTINGNAVVIPPGDALLEIPLGPLGSVTLNKETVDGTVLTRRAVEVVTPVATVVLAEAIAGHAAGACRDASGNPALPTTNTNTNTNTGGPGTGNPDVCPPGSTYDAGRNLCVIREGSTTIVVGRPFEGPSGGSVLSLTEARKRYNSVCLRGSGPKYAIIGTAGNDNITGTNGRDRILLLAGRDKAEGGRGDDCIDGGTGVDTMSGALGKDRLIGGSGGDHLVGGSHADFLQGGSGNDTIHSGFGKDKIDAGSGSDRINAATAGPASNSIRCGKGRDKIRVNRNETRKALSRKGACERVYVIR